MGITSLVQCSAAGATATTIAALAKKRLTYKVMDETLKNTLSVSCMFMWVILAALCFGAVFDGLGAVHAIKSLFIERWGLSPWGVLVMMQLSYILMGMFLDDTAMLIIVAPLYVPLVISLGFNPIWYGVLYTITCQIAYMTPPFGYNLFLMKAMAPKEVTLADIYRSIIPFVLVMMLGLVIVIAFPQIALWLPNSTFTSTDALTLGDCAGQFSGGLPAQLLDTFGESFGMSHLVDGDELHLARQLTVVHVVQAVVVVHVLMDRLQLHGPCLVQHFDDLCPPFLFRCHDGCSFLFADEFSSYCGQRPSQSPRRLSTRDLTCFPPFSSTF
jgi:hypothetical protein